MTNYNLRIVYTDNTIEEVTLDDRAQAYAAIFQYIIESTQKQNPIAAMLFEEVEEVNESEILSGGWSIRLRSQEGE